MGKLEKRLLSGFLFAALVCQSVAATEIDAVWIGTNTARWNDASKWDIGIVPNNTNDDIYHATLYIDSWSRKPVELETDITLESVNFARSIWLNSTTPVTLTVDGDFTLIDSEVTGSVNLVLNGDCFVNGAFSGNGLTTITETATMRIEKQLDGLNSYQPQFTRNIINYGSVVVSGSETEEINQGVDNIFLNHGVIDIQTPNQLHWKGTLENDHVVILSGGGLRCEGDSSGTFNIESGAELWLTDGDFSEATFSGEGDVFFSCDTEVKSYAITGQTRISGALELNSAETIELYDLEMYSGMLTSSADINISGDCLFRQRNYFTEGGQITIAPGSTVTLDSSGFYLGTGFTNFASLTTSDLVFRKASVDSVNDHFINYGTINTTTTLDIDLTKATNHGQIECLQFKCESGDFQNFGTIEITGNTSSHSTIRKGIVNNGELSVNSGYFFLRGLSQSPSGKFTTGGTTIVTIYGYDGFEPQGEFKFSGQTTLSDGELTLPADLTMENTGEILVSSDAQLSINGTSISGNGHIVIQQTTLSAEGSITGDLTLKKQPEDQFDFDFDRSKPVHLDVGHQQSTGVLSIGNDCTFDIIDDFYNNFFPSNINFEISGNQVGQVDRLSVGNNLQLGGNLEVSLLDGFSPSLNDEFVLIDAGTILGDFYDIDLPVLQQGLVWRYIQDATSIRIRVVRDYLYEWRLLNGKAANGDDDNADTSSNGISDLFYYAFGMEDLHDPQISYASTLPPTAGLATLKRENNKAKFSYTRRKSEYRNTLKTVLYYSTNLKQWFPFSEEQMQNVVTTPINEQYETISFEIPNETNQIFLRIRLFPVW